MAAHLLSISFADAVQYAFKFRWAANLNLPLHSLIWQVPELHRPGSESIPRRRL